MTLKRILPVFFTSFLLGCVPLSSSSFSSSLPSTSEQSDDKRGYDAFWRTSSLSFTFDIDPVVLTYIETYGAVKNDPFNDVYFPINLTLVMNEQTIVIHNVGIRQKGNIFSRGPFLNEEGHIVTPFHFRLSFDQLFDDAFYARLGIQRTWTPNERLLQQERRLFGMKSLEFKWNRSNDPSMINQVYASRMFQQLDVLSPSSTLGHIQWTIGDFTLDAGLYIINEAIDQTFLNRHFQGQASQGDLYKALYPVNLHLLDMASFSPSLNQYVFHAWMVGVENTEEGYHPTYDLKTNRTTSNHESLFTLVKTLYSMRLYSLEERLNRLESVVDISSFIRYASASFLIGNPDDMRNNTNNTYIYFHGETNKAYFIPYDNDWSLGITWNEDLTTWTATKSPYSSIDSFGQSIRNPLYWLTVIPDDGSLFAQTFPLMPTLFETYTQTLFSQSLHPFYTLDTYTALFHAYRDLYPSITPHIDNPSSFVHTDAFTYHHTEIMATLDALRS